ncbi:hypothetical protein E4U17_001089 [Claviceps sp. LM77 group G4]|nr:hypothetical protein E4U17_001089 [Claviceps sp. LM77 group G4]KAG6078054.1 hypothetical protein E4U33_000950 [Claviceps sp. LM78 group G4]KAG6078381.1 hypothetical protein E4U16_001696 [Claviceps sp. LM84 group G4]
MSRAIRAAIGRMELYLLHAACPGRRDQILRGNGVFGMRAAPTPCRDNDRTIRVRLEYEEILFNHGARCRRYYLRVNKNAHDMTLRALALVSRTDKLAMRTPHEIMVHGIRRWNPEPKVPKLPPTPTPNCQCPMVPLCKSLKARYLRQVRNYRGRPL